MTDDSKPSRESQHLISFSTPPHHGPVPPQSVERSSLTSVVTSSPSYILDCTNIVQSPKDHCSEYCKVLESFLEGYVRDVLTERMIATFNESRLIQTLTLLLSSTPPKTVDWLKECFAEHIRNLAVGIDFRVPLNNFFDYIQTTTDDGPMKSCELAESALRSVCPQLFGEEGSSLEKVLCESATRVVEVLEAMNDLTVPANISKLPDNMMTYCEFTTPVPNSKINLSAGEMPSWIRRYALGSNQKHVMSSTNNILEGIEIEKESPLPTKPSSPPPKQSIVQELNERLIQTESKIEDLNEKFDIMNKLNTIIDCCCRSAAVHPQTTKITHDECVQVEVAMSEKSTNTEPMPETVDNGTEMSLLESVDASVNTAPTAELLHKSINTETPVMNSVPCGQTPKRVVSVGVSPSLSKTRKPAGNRSITQFEKSIGHKQRDEDVQAMPRGQDDKKMEELQCEVDKLKADKKTMLETLQQLHQFNKRLKGELEKQKGAASRIK